jgi:hypothetical protein
MCSLWNHTANLITSLCIASQYFAFCVLMSSHTDLEPLEDRGTFMTWIVNYLDDNLNSVYSLLSLLAFVVFETRSHLPAQAGFRLCAPFSWVAETTCVSPHLAYLFKNIYCLLLYLCISRINKINIVIILESCDPLKSGWWSWGCSLVIELT